MGWMDEWMADVLRTMVRLIICRITEITLPTNENKERMIHSGIQRRRERVRNRKESRERKRERV